MKLKRYAIKENFDNQDHILGILNYDEESKNFTIDIAPELSAEEAPFILESFIERGERHALLIKNQGSCCQDECYIEEIE